MLFTLHKRFCLFVSLTLALLPAGYVGEAHAQAGPPPAPPVSVAQPLQRKVTQWDEFTGRFEAKEQVDVRARVSGFIDKIHFRDGQMIKQGDLLFTIDPRPYALTAEAATAEVARTKAQVALALNDVDRADSLSRSQTITVRDVDQRRSTLAVARAAQQAAEANLKTAELNLEWTQVRAPLAGRISDKRVDAGNLIAGGQAGATLLTTIVTMDPINFVFEASEADYLRYTRLAATGARPGGRDAPNAVQVRLADEPNWGREGRMDFVDNALSTRSSTIRGRAVFDNKDQSLTPGTFGRMRLFAGEIDAMLVPDGIIVSDQTRKVIMTVGPDNKVVPKPVILGPIAFGLRVVRSGLSSDDRVIVQGIANPMVRPGVTVSPQPGEIKFATN